MLTAAFLPAPFAFDLWKIRQQKNKDVHLTLCVVE